MNIIKGDKVVVIAGKDRGKTGTVLRAFPKDERVLVEGVNKKKKHQKARQAGKPGQIIEKEFPVHISNVMIADPKSSNPSRVGIERKEGKRVRVAKKSNQEV